jgi:hypothetical protein
VSLLQLGREGAAYFLKPKGRCFEDEVGDGGVSSGGVGVGGGSFAPMMMTPTSPGTDTHRSTAGLTPEPPRDVLPTGNSGVMRSSSGGSVGGAAGAGGAAVAGAGIGAGAGTSGTAAVSSLGDASISVLLSAVPSTRVDASTFLAGSSSARSVVDDDSVTSPVISCLSDPKGDDRPDDVVVGDDVAGSVPSSPRSSDFSTCDDGDELGEGSGLALSRSVASPARSPRSDAGADSDAIIRIAGQGTPPRRRPGDGLAGAAAAAGGGVGDGAAASASSTVLTFTAASVVLAARRNSTGSLPVDAAAAAAAADARVTVLPPLPLPLSSPSIAASAADAPVIVPGARSQPSTPVRRGVSGNGEYPVFRSEPRVRGSRAGASSSSSAVKNVESKPRRRRRRRRLAAGKEPGSWSAEARPTTASAAQEPPPMEVRRTCFVHM